MWIIETFTKLCVFRARILLVRMFLGVASDGSLHQKALHAPGKTTTEAPGGASLMCELFVDKGSDTCARKHGNQCSTHTETLDERGLWGEGPRNGSPWATSPARVTVLCVFNLHFQPLEEKEL